VSVEQVSVPAALVLQLVGSCMQQTIGSRTSVVRGGVLCAGDCC
jgi:hypothetical protein